MGKSVRSILIYLLWAWSLFLCCRCMKWTGNNEKGGAISVGPRPHLCGGEKKHFPIFGTNNVHHSRERKISREKSTMRQTTMAPLVGKRRASPPRKSCKMPRPRKKNPRVPIISLPLFSARDCYSNFPSQMTVCFWEREAKFSCSLLSTHSFPPQTNE